MRDQPWYEALAATVSDNPQAFIAGVGTDLIVTLLALGLLLFVVERWTRASVHDVRARELWDEARKANEEERVHLLQRYLKNAARVFAVLLFFGLVALRYSIPVLSEVASSARLWLVTEGFASFIRIAFVAFFASALLRLVRKASQALTPLSGQYFERRYARSMTIRSVIESSLQIAVATIFVLFVLSELGTNISALIAGVGIFGLAIGFGAQSLVKDVISGFFILVEDQFGVGDLIRVGDLSGMVETMNLRITTLRDLEGRVHIIPNGQIDKVTVMSKEWSRAVLDVEVSYNTDLERALRIVEDEATAMAQDEAWAWRILEPPTVLGVEALGASGIMLRCTIKTLPKEQFGVAREFRKRIKARLEREGIEIPFPHLSVYWGQDQAPLLRAKEPSA
jgi:small conductance mechanosensitive channel